MGNPGSRCSPWEQLAPAHNLDDATSKSGAKAHIEKSPTEGPNAWKCPGIEKRLLDHENTCISTFLRKKKPVCCKRLPVNRVK